MTTTNITENSPQFEEGMTVRRAVLGDEYVDASLARSTGFSEPLQKMVTEVVWGGVWTRGGLPRKTRSMLNLGILAALGQQHELKAHTRGALNNGCTPEEMVEIVLQVAAYCGAPAALAAMRTVQETVEQVARENADAEGRG